MEAFMLRKTSGRLRRWAGFFAETGAILGLALKQDGPDVGGGCILEATAIRRSTIGSRWNPESKR
jgi:hypothetical protein